MKDEIKNWLRFENFAAGIQLLAKYQQRNDLVNKYQGITSATATQRNELLAAMQAIMKNDIQTPKEVEKVAVVPKPSSQGGKLAQGQQDKCKELLRKRSALHTAMKAAISDDERYKLATEIKSMTKRIDEAYDTLRYIEEHGKLPFNKTDEAVLIKKGIDMIRNLQSLKSQLSQARKVNDKDKVESLVKDIEELTNKIEEYDK